MSDVTLLVETMYHSDPCWSPGRTFSLNVQVTPLGDSPYRHVPTSVPPSRSSGKGSEVTRSSGESVIGMKNVSDADGGDVRVKSVVKYIAPASLMV